MSWSSSAGSGSIPASEQARRRGQPGPRARHLGRRRPVRRALGQEPVLRRRGRAVHQRQRRRDGRVLRRGHGAARRAAPGRAAPRRRLELRGRERRDRVVVRDDDQRPGGPARARAGDRRLGRGRRGTTARRGVHARAPALPPEVDRRGDRPELAPSSRSRPGTTTTSCAGSSTCAKPAPSPTSASPRRSGVVEGNSGSRRPLAAPERPPGRVPLRDGRGGGRSRAAGTRSEPCACSTGSAERTRSPK